MNLDAAKFEEEKKKKKLAESEKKKQLEAVAKQQEMVEKAEKQSETNQQLSHLKDLLEHHDIDDIVIKKVDKISASGTIDKEQMEEILSMIDELQSDEKQNKYVPVELRVTKDEYVHALTDEGQRQQTLQKLDTALGVLAQHISPSTQASINISGMLSMVLDKHLIVVQENHIDIKRSLEEKDGKKVGGFWSQLSQIFK